MSSLKEHHDNRVASFEVESLKGGLIRGDLARAVVEAGWDLNELRTAAMSLEEIFLQLTGTAAAATKRREAEEAVASQGSPKGNEKYLDHLPKELQELFRFAGRVSAADHVRRHFRLLLLERRCGYFVIAGHGSADARPGSPMNINE